MDVNIDYQKLKTTIDRARVVNGHQFEYQNITFNVFTHKHLKRDEKEGELPIFYINNSSTADYDIYIATNVVKKEFRKPVLLHETLEAFLQEYFCEEFDDYKASEMAHKIAIGYDEEYAREILSDELFKEYLGLRQRLTGFFGNQ